MPIPYEPGSRFRVREEFPPGFFDGLAATLIIQTGDRITVSSEESKTWPAFALVSNEHGAFGWVPKRYLRREGDTAIVAHDYDTTCLNPSRGESLELIEADVEGGWLRCRDSQGRVGWFPIKLLEPVGSRSNGFR
jgi:uncharacterized protein YgiM (DUF1202 family)